MKKAVTLACNELSSEKDQKSAFLTPNIKYTSSSLNHTELKMNANFQSPPAEGTLHYPQFSAMSTANSLTV